MQHSNSTHSYSAKDIYKLSNDTSANNSVNENSRTIFYLHYGCSYHNIIYKQHGLEYKIADQTSIT